MTSLLLSRQTRVLLEKKGIHVSQGRLLLSLFDGLMRGTLPVSTERHLDRELDSFERRWLLAHVR